MNMPSNSLQDGDINLQEMKTKSPTCPSGGYHMYDVVISYTCISIIRVNLYLKGIP